VFPAALPEAFPAIARIDIFLHSRPWPFTLVSLPFFPLSFFSTLSRPLPPETRIFSPLFFLSVLASFLEEPPVWKNALSRCMRHIADRTGAVFVFFLFLPPPPKPPGAFKMPSASDHNLFRTLRAPRSIQALSTCFLVPCGSPPVLRVWQTGGFELLSPQSPPTFLCIFNCFWPLLTFGHVSPSPQSGFCGLTGLALPSTSFFFFSRQTSPIKET